MSSPNNSSIVVVKCLRHRITPIIIATKTHINSNIDPKTNLGRYNKIIILAEFNTTNHHQFNPRTET